VISTYHAGSPDGVARLPEVIFHHSHAAYSGVGDVSVDSQSRERTIWVHGWWAIFANERKEDRALGYELLQEPLRKPRKKRK
jgi:hypothetical protein